MTADVEAIEFGSAADVVRMFGKATSEEAAQIALDLIDRAVALLAASSVALMRLLVLRAPQRAYDEGRREGERIARSEIRRSLGFSGDGRVER